MQRASEFQVGMQELTAQSTMEAELVVAELAMKEAVYFAGMMRQLGFEEVLECVPIHVGNNTALYVAGNKIYGVRANSWLRGSSTFAR